jgi:hypothetical protein
MERLINVENQGVSIERTYFDPETDHVRVELTVDTGKLLDDVADIRRETGGKSPSGELRLVGSIIVAHWALWAAEQGIPDPYNAVYKPEHEKDVFRFITEHPRLSPTEGRF